MSAGCPELHELLAHQTRPAGDPERLHLDSCPRCRNRVALYADFTQPASLPAEADLADAERRLGASLRTLRGAAQASPAPDRVPDRLPRATREKQGFLQSLLAPFGNPSPWRLAVAGGGLIVAVALVMIRPWGLGGPDPTGTLRDEGSTRELELKAPSALSDGRIRLAWTPDPEAEAYRVRVLGPDLTEILSRDLTGATALVIERATLPASIPPGTVLGWNVAVLRGGGEIRRSSTGTLRAP
jgi:hypothetical protein